ncbi:hypothetical protein B0H11DRAFT_1914323 [Mycena galericulata]|nr:hypothetical protein B0H11DRAFT_1914323 [Mycena galericulata]
MPTIIHTRTYTRTRHTHLHPHPTVLAPAHVRTRAEAAAAHLTGSNPARTRTQHHRCLALATLERMLVMARGSPRHSGWRESAAADIGGWSEGGARSAESGERDGGERAVADAANRRGRGEGVDASEAESASRSPALSEAGIRDDGFLRDVREGRRGGHHAIARCVSEEGERGGWWHRGRQGRGSEMRIGAETHLGSAAAAAAARGGWARRECGFIRMTCVRAAGEAGDEGQKAFGVWVWFRLPAFARFAFAIEEDTRRREKFGGGGEGGEDLTRFEDEDSTKIDADA